MLWFRGSSLELELVVKMDNIPVLSLLTFLPLVGAFFIFLIRGSDSELVAHKSKVVAVFVSAFTFAVSLFVCMDFDPNAAGFQFEERYEWFPEMGISYHMGIDGISLFFVLLSTFLTPFCIVASWGIKNRVKEYMVAFLILECFMIGTFTSMDAILFYVFFEAVLIPMYLIIGVWGGPNRVYSSYKFFLYTLAGSVLMLLGLLALYYETGTTDIPELINYDVPLAMQPWIWLAFFASFAVKMPMWPVHTWLPDAHVEAPTAGSVILAGVLLKMGGYGFIRFSLSMLPEASFYFTPLIMWLSVIAIIYMSLVALVQKDMKKMIAYSSVAHMGFVTIGLFSVNVQGISGAVFQMLSHGLISGALFLCVGVVYDRLHTREISRYGGIVRNMPIYATLFMILMLGSVGLPGTSGFVGEFLTLIGLYRGFPLFTFIAGFGVVLGAAYMLLLYRKVIFGPQENEDAAAMKDVSKREIGLLAPLVVLVLWFGIAPGFVLDRVGPAVNTLMAHQLGTSSALKLSRCNYDFFQMFDRNVFDNAFYPEKNAKYLTSVEGQAGVVDGEGIIDFKALEKRVGDESKDIQAKDD